MKLYVVATPIGNLADFTSRGIETLSSADLIAAEDTRHSRLLLQQFGIETPMVSYHDHNESDMSETLVQKMIDGTTVALISDAGTPLISDPGYRLVRLALDRGVKVIPIPGASALTTALSVSGLATDRFKFIGFLPSKKEARREVLSSLSSEQGTLIFYESRHRIAESLSDMAENLGENRRATIARELTKRFEQICHGELDSLCQQIESGDIVAKGEFVVMVEGKSGPVVQYEHEPLLSALLEELPPRKAANIVSKLTNESSKALYNLAVQLKNKR